MALTTCPECGTQVSNKAAHCPKCGAPIQERLRTATRLAYVGCFLVFMGLFLQFYLTPLMRDKNFEWVNNNFYRESYISTISFTYACYICAVAILASAYYSYRKVKAEDAETGD